MKKICVFTLYEEKAASSRYRAYIFRKEIEKRYDVRWYAFWNNYYIEKCMYNKKKHIFEICILYFVFAIRRIFQLLFIAPKMDVVFIQKDCIPYINRHFLTKAKKNNVRIIYDIDDANYSRPKDNSDTIASIADVVICGNNTLRDHYSKVNDNCTILPTIEETWKYRQFWGDTFEKKIIGWIGSKNTVPNLEIAAEALNLLISKHPEVSFRIISDSDGGITQIIKNSYLCKWGINTYLNDLSEISVGIMPLQDTEYNRGKCGFKLIQYLNMRKPVVGTGLGVNIDIIKGNGLVANDTEGWVNALEDLLFKKEIYDNCVEHIDEVFFSEYSYDSGVARLLNILEGNHC